LILRRHRLAMTLMITLDPFAFPHADWGRELFWAQDIKSHDRRASCWLNYSAADFLVCLSMVARMCVRDPSIVDIGKTKRSSLQLYCCVSNADLPNPTRGSVDECEIGLLNPIISSDKFAFQRVLSWKHPVFADQAFSAHGTLASPSPVAGRGH
jgi:hypothetical protein